MGRWVVFFLYGASLKLNVGINNDNNGLGKQRQSPGWSFGLTFINETNGSVSFSEPKTLGSKVK